VQNGATLWQRQTGCQQGATGDAGRS
jgi:hypothetical protein